MHIIENWKHKKQRTKPSITTSSLQIFLQIGNEKDCLYFSDRERDTGEVKLFSWSRRKLWLGITLKTTPPLLSHPTDFSIYKASAGWLFPRGGHPKVQNRILKICSWQHLIGYEEGTMTKREADILCSSWKQQVRDT